MHEANINRIDLHCRRDARKCPAFAIPLPLGLLFIVDERKHDRLSFAVDACDISRIDRLATLSSPPPPCELSRGSRIYP